MTSNTNQSGVRSVANPAKRHSHFNRNAIRAVAIAVSKIKISSAPLTRMSEGGVVPTNCVTIPHQAPIKPENKGGYSP